MRLFPEREGPAKRSERDGSPRAGTLLGLFALFALAASGCAVLKPIDFGPRGKVTDPEVAILSMVARRDHVRSVRGEAKASIQSPQGEGKISVLVVAGWPARIRLETVSFFGNPLAVLTSDGSQFALQDVEHHQFVQGPATAENVSKLLPAPFEPAVLVSLVVGLPPEFFAATSSKLELDDFRRCYVLTMTRGAAMEIVGLDPATLHPLWLRMNKAASPTAFEATFDDYDKDSDLPQRIAVKTADPSTSVELHWRDREVNAAVAPGVFTQQAPETPAGK